MTLQGEIRRWRSPRIRFRKKQFAVVRFDDVLRASGMSAFGALVAAFGVYEYEEAIEDGDESKVPQKAD